LTNRSFNHYLPLRLNPNLKLSHLRGWHPYPNPRSYQIRGEIFLKQNNAQAAKAEFEKAVLYNRNYQPAKDALNQLGSL
jgi:predicted negative regulator of RcsB-dependent stress response